MFRRAKTIALAIGVLTSSLPATTGAQSAAEWRFDVTPYFWMAGLDGQVGIRQVAANVDLSFRDILDALKFGIMGTANARYKQYVLGVDALYISLGEEAAIAFRGDTGSLRLSLKQTMIQPTAGYTFLSASSGFDLLVGFRYWNLSADIDVDRTRRPSNQRSGSRSWVDGTAGVQAHWNPQAITRITLGGDIGAGGSRWTWQAYGGVGVDVATWCTLGLMYRGLSVDYDRDSFLFDTNMQGLLVAATFRIP